MIKPVVITNYDVGNIVTSLSYISQLYMGKRTFNVSLKSDLK
jgi:hypothetical protein